MRRDIGFYVEAPIDRTYQAYLLAATNPPFERECKEEPLHTISFGVNFSFKYNMNGGACTIHLMPSGGGTAVNMRFSLAQGAGARYERYAEDLNKAMRKFLPVNVRAAGYTMEDFLRPENQVTPEKWKAAVPAAPAAPTAPVYQPVPVATVYQPAPTAPVYHPAAPVVPGARSCANCGSLLTPGARFCSYCGAPVMTNAPKVCPNCRTQAPAGAAFCAACGTRL